LALGTMYFRAKNFEDAKKWLTQAVDNASTAGDAHFYLGRIARQEGSLDEAQREQTQANALHPGNPDVLAELGQVAVATRHYPDAQKYLDEAIALDKVHYAANFALLQLYARTSDPRRATQSARFDAIRDQSQEQYKEAMRIIEIRPDARPAK
jgi:Flp pilus assembly protein TadD